MSDLPPVIVISLKRSHERRQKMAAALDSLHLPFQFFDAIEGAELNIATLPDYHGRRRRLFFGQDLTPGEIGCTLSHRAVFEKMIQENIPHALILEDDAVLHTDLPQVLKTLMTQNNTWDIIRFLCREKTMRASRAVRLLFGPYELTRPFGTPGGAYGYLLSQKAAARLISFMQCNWQPNDMLLGQTWRTHLRVYAVRPSPIVSDDDQTLSTIGPERFIKPPPLQGLEKIIHPIARMVFKTWEAIGKRIAWWSYKMDKP